MTDIHCHILPGFDDGAADMAEALNMIRMSQASGVTDLAVTPHFMGERQSLGLLNRMYVRYERLTHAVRTEGIPIRLYPGAEILCLPQTVELAREHLLPTLGNSSYVLCEFYFDTPFEEMDAILDEIAACGYQPVVAHPERYEAIQNDPRGVDLWFRKGFVIQLNKGSILGAFGYRVQKTAEWILGGGLAHVVASDAHSISRRTTDMQPVREHLLQKYPAEYVQILTQYNPARLLRGLEMFPDFRL
ncbi:MAG: hypothetical protein E7431_04975 [Ruminococcaceae bacterium]|nr:hypothetical protein [Oscillospiraceae bacterium]